jgi:hypothetical protein
VVALTTATAPAHWKLWQHFCLDLCVDLELDQVMDPLLLLYVFAQCYHTGSIVAGGK